MPAAPITCPKCRTTQRPSKSAPPGAVIQCPKCATRFRTGAADDFASFTREDPEANPRRRGGCGFIVAGCLLLLAPLLGAGAVLGYCAVVYWLPGVQAALNKPATNQGPQKP